MLSPKSYPTAQELLDSTRTTIESPSKVLSPRSVLVAALILILGFATLTFALVFAPWVQTVRGVGKVIAFAPNERQQSITASVDGRIKEWYIHEGDHVKEGQPLVDIIDIDPDIMSRLERERKANEIKLEASQQALTTSKKNVDRQKFLVIKGLSSQRSAELAELEYAKYLSDVSSASAELARIETRLARQASQIITSPRTGVVQRILAPQGGVIVKTGEDIAVVVPESSSTAVELLVSGNDMPLLTVNRKVRLQFEGWPAVQFTGWPSVAIGTFGGVIKVIDPSDNGMGQFRIIVFPDEHTKWPEPLYLRQGVRAVGWVLLDSVRLGWEMWRQFNGFPPTVSNPKLVEMGGPVDKKTK
jgi:multidrug efflux pump subunit AcrA (membrane-fusion protein)